MKPCRAAGVAVSSRMPVAAEETMEDPVADTCASAIVAIYARDFDRLVRFATKFLGDYDRAFDATHDVFRKLLDKSHTYVTPGLAWSSLEHRCLDILRVEARERIRTERSRCENAWEVETHPDNVTAVQVEAAPDPGVRLQNLLRRHAKRLTRRQWQVLTMTTAGKTDAQIARALQIQAKTVANHRAGAVKVIRDGERERERLIRRFRRAAALAPTTS
jgi:DNA-directed RNA polymerase specialized sigma24 family protein